MSGNLELGASVNLVFEGSTADSFETVLTVADPTADRTITLPNRSGTVITSADNGTVTSTMIANSTIVNADISGSAAIAFSKLQTGALPSAITVNSSNIVNGSIVNADINSAAAIADTKLATISTADKVSLSALNLDGGTDIGAGLQAGDEFAVYDTSAGTIKKADAYRIRDYVNAQFSGDITVTAPGVASISAGVIVNSDINSSANIAVSKLANGTARQLLQTNAAGNGVEFTSNVDIPGTLDVTGVTNLDGSLTVAGDIRGKNGSPTDVAFTFSSDSDTGMYRNGSNSLAFATGGSRRVLIGNSGQVAINRGDTVTMLDVSGHGLFASSNRAHGVELTDSGEAIVFSSNESPALKFRDSRTGSTLAMVGKTAANSLNFAAGGTTTDMLLQSNGRLGLGTSSPQVHLDVGGSTSGALNGLSNSVAYLGYTTASNLYGGVVAGAGPNGNSPFVAASKKNDGTALPLDFYTAGSRRVRIHSGGQFNIGSTASTEGLLNVESPSDLGANTGSKIVLVSAAADTSSGNNCRVNTYVERVASGASWNTADFKIQRTTDVTDKGFVNFRPNDFVLGYGTNNAMFIKADGDIGIGVENPAAALEIRDSEQKGIIVYATSTQATDTNKAFRVRNNSATDNVWVSYKGAAYLKEELRVNASSSTGGSSITTGSHIEAGRGSGSVAMTINDGHGNANIAFNHLAGYPDVDGSSARIETAVDASTAEMRFELANSVSSGVSTALTGILSLKTGVSDFLTGELRNQGNKVWHAGNDGSGSGLDADTLDGIQSGSFLRSDQSDTMSGTLTVNGGATNWPLRLTGSSNYKLLLQGATNPQIRFEEGTTNKAEIKWSSSGYLDLHNIESDERLRIQSGTNGLKYLVGSSSYTVWHSGNDGANSQLDAGKLAGLAVGSFLRSDAEDTASSRLTLRGGSNNVHAATFERNSPTSNQVGIAFKSSAVSSENRYFGKGTDGNPYWGSSSNITTNNKMWHAGNDGANSGLHADLLDGQHGSYYSNFNNLTNKPDPTITLDGDVTGSVTLTNLTDGTLTCTVVNDSHNHDGRYFTETEVNNKLALKANLAGATFAGDVQVHARLDVGDGTGNDHEIRIYKADNNTADHIQFYNGTTRVGEIGCIDDTWLRINNQTAKNIYTPRMIRADGGFQVDGQSVIDANGGIVGAKVTGTVADATNAVQLKTARTLWGQSFNGTANIAGQIVGATNVYGSAGADMIIQPQDGTTARHLRLRGNNDTDGNGGHVYVGHQSRGITMMFTGSGNYRFYKKGSNSVYALFTFDNITSNRTITWPDGGGTVAFTSSNITGNAATATRLQTGRTLWGQSFDGTANISGQITGATNVIGSNGNMTIQPADSTTARTLYLRGNNDTDGGGGAVVIGHEGRGALHFRSSIADTAYRFYKPGTTDRYGVLKFDGLSANRTYTFPNTSGTIAVTTSTVSNANNLGGVAAANYLRSNANDSASGQMSFTGGISVSGKDIYFSNTALIANDQGGAFADRTGSNIDHIWHDDGNNRWHFCSDTTYKGSGNSKVKAGTFEGALSGNATTATTATKANTVEVQHDTGNAWHRPLFVDDGGSSNAHLQVRSDNASTIGINPSQNSIRANAFVGNATSATTATNATNLGNVPSTQYTRSNHLSGNFNTKDDYSSVTSIQATSSSDNAPDATINKWWNFVNIRHRGGLEDGDKYGGQICFPMTGGNYNAVYHRTEDNGSWKGWKRFHTEAEAPRGNHDFRAGVKYNGTYGTTKKAFEAYYKASNHFTLIQGSDTTSNSNLVFRVDVNGAKKIKFTGAGNGYFDGGADVGNADYAEYFEWTDGNPQNEDRRGYPVVLVEDKVRIATDSDDPSDIIGVVSAAPGVCGDSAENGWHNRELRDAFGSKVITETEVLIWKEDDEASYTQEQHDAGNIPLVDGEPEALPAEVQPTEYDDGVESMPITENFPDDLVGRVPSWAIANNNRGTIKSYTPNPDYNPDREYIPRSQRQEWAAIGLMGKLVIHKGVPTNPRWRRMKDVNNALEKWLVM